MKTYLVIAFMLSLSAAASQQAGTLTQVDGTVKIFTNPGKTVQGPPPHALFEGEYYSVKDASMGDRVEKGNIVRTAPGSKARVVFENGDQINVGSGTAYRVFWDKDSANAKTQINLMYGKMRGVIEKGGPRTRLTVKTKSATMGVRGTDFFIADNGTDGGTEVSILRGSVEVKAETPTARPVEVKAGYSAEVPAAAAPVVARKAEKAPEPAPVLAVRKTTREDLVAIQKSSEVKAEIKKEIANEEVTKKIEQLEKKAVETTIRDIKAADPKLYAQIQNKDIKSPPELNTRAVETLMKTAPKAPEKRKPYLNEIDDLERGAYERYFRIVD